MSSRISRTLTVPARLYHTDGNSLDAMPEGTEVYSYMIYLVGCVLAVGCLVGRVKRGCRFIKYTVCLLLAWPEVNW